MNSSASYLSLCAYSQNPIATAVSRHGLQAPLRFIVIDQAQRLGITGGKEIPGVLSVVAINRELGHEAQSAGRLCPVVYFTVRPARWEVSNSLTGKYSNPRPTHTLG